MRQACAARRRVSAADPAAEMLALRWGTPLLMFICGPIYGMAFGGMSTILDSLIFYDAGDVFWCMWGFGYGWNEVMSEAMKEGAFAGAVWGFEFAVFTITLSAMRMGALDAFRALGFGSLLVAAGWISGGSLGWALATALPTWWEMFLPTPTNPTELP